MRRRNRDAESLDRQVRREVHEAHGHPTHRDRDLVLLKSDLTRITPGVDVDTSTWPKLIETHRQKDRTLRAFIFDHRRKR